MCLLLTEAPVAANDAGLSSTARWLITWRDSHSRNCLVTLTTHARPEAEVEWNFGTLREILACATPFLSRGRTRPLPSDIELRVFTGSRMTDAKTQVQLGTQNRSGSSGQRAAPMSRKGTPAMSRWDASRKDELPANATNDRKGAGSRMSASRR